MKQTIMFMLLFLVSVSVKAEEMIYHGDKALHRGVYEIKVQTNRGIDDPYLDLHFQVEFTRPDGTKTTAEGFYDGYRTYKARAYCDTQGTWNYEVRSNLEALEGIRGTFEVIPSELPGKLRIHPEDSRQFAYDNGEWFLHIGDTGYRFVVQSEPKWQEYIDQAAEAGFTKIRTWFAQSRSTVEALYTPERERLVLNYWQEIEKRLLYCLEHYPHILVQLIPYAEDTQELIRYGQGDRLSQFIAGYAQARWSSFPNIYWEISNDREIVEEEDLSQLSGREISRHVIDQIGMDMKKREPWGTLITNQQNRFAGYSFVDASWSDMITLEDIDEAAGELVLEYREKGNDPVVLDEDRYEMYRDPANARYYFRRLMWANLLSGGHATYGGLRTYEAYDGGLVRGVQGYYDANRKGVLSQGAHDFKHIHTFFEESNLTLAGMRPADERVGGEPKRAKCIHDEQNYIIYLPNPDGEDVRSDNPRIDGFKQEVELPAGDYQLRWFNPRRGRWVEGKQITVEGAYTLENPTPEVARTGVKDWIAWLEKRD